MGDNSKIEWTDATWNPVVGCTRVSEGCRNCYAFALHDQRHAAFKAGKSLPVQYAKPFSQVQLMEGRLDQPLRWKRPRKIFVNSLSDLFHQDVPDSFIDQVMAVAALSPHHTFQILTKRPERAADHLLSGGRQICVMAAMHAPSGKMSVGPIDWPLRNVLLGFSAEDQKTFDARWPAMRPLAQAGWRIWTSIEPQLGPITLPPEALWAGSGLKWVVSGGESGPEARPMHPDWPRALRDQCVPAGLPFFFKQWGEWAPFTDTVAHYGHIMDNASYNRALQRMIRHYGGSKLVDDRPEGWDASMIEHGVGVTGPDQLFLLNVGKKKAGRLLDTRTWDEYPVLIPSTAAVP